MLKRKEELDYPARGCQFFLFLSRSEGDIKSQARLIQQPELVAFDFKSARHACISALVEQEGVTVCLGAVLLGSHQT